jgi:hypothetical protein
MSGKTHVIVLGAGASWSSGYPLADRLRLLTCSRKDFIEYVDEKIANTPFAGRQGQLIEYFDRIKGATELFRRGGFATVDEFCYLAGERFPNEVKELKRLMRLIFMLHDAEKDFHKSDYYPFVQRLFKSNLHDLRDDIAVLSFNYDTHFEYLLWTAHCRRKESIGQNPDQAVLDDISSGFYMRSLAPRLDKRRLVALKLHGLCLMPTSSNKAPALTYGHSFDTSERNSLHDHFTKFHDTMPPIVFPWELHNSDGERYIKEKFCLTDRDLYSAGSELSYMTTDIHSVFDAIWTQAQRVVSNASRISFVGLSMHEYLKPGLRLLFNVRARWFSQRLNSAFQNIDVVIANPDAQKSNGKMAQNYQKVLEEVCPQLQPSIRTRVDFLDFIQHEMDPLV